MGGAEFVGQCEQVTKLLAETLQRHGGSVSAEHGIGLVKKAYLSSTRSEAEIEVMRGIRRVLDPHGIMNPGKLSDRCAPPLRRQGRVVLDQSDPWVLLCLRRRRSQERRRARKSVVQGKGGSVSIVTGGWGIQ